MRKAHRRDVFELKKITKNSIISLNVNTLGLLLYAKKLFVYMCCCYCVGGMRFLMVFAMVCPIFCGLTVVFIFRVFMWCVWGWVMFFKEGGFVFFRVFVSSFIIMVCMFFCSWGVKLCRMSLSIFMLIFMVSFPLLLLGVFRFLCILFGWLVLCVACL